MCIMVDVVHGFSTIEIGVNEINCSQDKSRHADKVNADFVQRHENNGCEYHRRYSSGSTELIIAMVMSIFEILWQLRHDYTNKIKGYEVYTSLGISKKDFKNLFNHSTEEIQRYHVEEQVNKIFMNKT